MRLFLYKVGEGTPMRTIENVQRYTADSVTTEDGTIYEPLAEGYELSSLPDCSETLRADWREAHPDAEQRVEDLEELLALLLFGGEGE